MEAIVGYLEVREGVAQDEVAIPVHEVGEQDLVVLVLDDRRMDTQERLRVRPISWPGGK